MQNYSKNHINGHSSKRVAISVGLLKIKNKKHILYAHDPGHDTFLWMLERLNSGWLRQERSYIAPVAIGATMRAGVAGKVYKSADSNFKVGVWYCMLMLRVEYDASPHFSVCSIVTVRT